MIVAIAIIIAEKMSNNENKVYSVSEFNSLIKAILGDNLPGRLTIRG